EWAQRSREWILRGKIWRRGLSDNVDAILTIGDDIERDIPIASSQEAAPLERARRIQACDVDVGAGGVRIAPTAIDNARDHISVAPGVDCEAVRGCRRPRREHRLVWVDSQLDHVGLISLWEV